MCEASRTALVASWHLPRVHGFPCRASPADTPGSATYDPRPSLPAREWRGIANARGLFLDSRGVDVTIAYNAIFASRHRLAVILFQGPHQGCACFRRTWEH